MTNIEIRAINVLLLGVSCLFLSSCTKTVGEEFREIVADIDAQCKRDRMGPYLDKNDPEYKNKKAQTTCDILSIKPADPLATEEGRFAYSIKLPAPHNKSNVQYHKGMSAESYFKELCEKDAGEWIFRTVEGVEGVFQGRNLNTNLSSAGYSDLIFQTREAGSASTNGLEYNLVQPYHGRYNYLERPIDTNETGKPYIRYYRGEEIKGHPTVGTQKNKRPIEVPYIVNKEQVDILKSRYGFTLRQLIDEQATENGIAGNELIIFDRTTNEVLAFKRAFIRFWSRSDSRWSRLTNREVCNLGSPQFIQRVLVPINPTE